MPNERHRIDRSLGLSRGCRRRQPSRHSSLIGLIVAFGGAVLCGLTGAGPVAAAIKHVPAASFGVEGSGSGQFVSPSGVAVNESTGLVPTAGAVYVVDTGNKRVERFDAGGAFGHNGAASLVGRQ